MPGKTAVSLKAYSAKAAALLQLCRDGKSEDYGQQLAELTIYNSDRDFIFEVEESHVLREEIEAYREISKEYTVRTALGRWRQTHDEVDAEIVFLGYKLLEPQLSHAELHAVWYDCAAKRARDMLNRMEETFDAGDLSKLIYELGLLTVDIPTETGRDFPYDRVLLGWPGGSTERSFRACVQTQIIAMVNYYRGGRCKDWSHLADRPDVRARDMYSKIKLRANEWRFPYDALELTEVEIVEIDKLPPYWRELVGQKGEQ